MIRQLDFLTGFALRAVRDSHPSQRRTDKSTSEMDGLDAMVRRGQARDDLNGEPPLDEILADPIVRKMMSSDDVDDSDLMQVMGKEPDQES